VHFLPSSQDKSYVILKSALAKLSHTEVNGEVRNALPQNHIKSMVGDPHPHYFWKLDPYPHLSEKLDPDPL
jgi:hypothetical protein